GGDQHTLQGARLRAAHQRPGRRHPPRLGPPERACYDVPAKTNRGDTSMTDTVARAEQRYDRSEALFREAQQYLAGGVRRNFRPGAPPLPLFFERAEGSQLFDVDGNSYVDYMLAMGPVVLGHAAPGPVRAAREWLEKGQLFGAQSTVEVEFGKRVCA